VALTSGTTAGWIAGRRASGHSSHLDALASEEDEVQIDLNKLENPSVLHICTRYMTGGSEQRIRDICRALPNAKHTIVIGRDSSPDLLRRQLPFAEVVVERSLCRELRPISDLKSTARIRRLIATGDYHVVITHQSKAGVLGRVAAGISSRVPVVHSLSMASFGKGYSGIESVIFSRVERWLSRWTDAYLVVGRDLARRFELNGIDPKKLIVVRSAVTLPDPDLCSAGARSRAAELHDLPLDRPWILYLGSLDDRKNVMSLPIMFQQVLLRTSTQPLLLLVGEGPRRQDVEAMINQIGLGDDTRVLGYVNNPNDLVAGSDVVVLLSKSEGLPQVLVQAAAAGTRFVATDVDGVDELFDLGAEGTVVDHGDVLAAACETARYLNSPIPPSGGSSRVDLESWHKDKIASAYSEILTSVIQRRHNNSR
jgi:glycosyltransferase involved in cell wall biosynthesis